jgi:hypothetical protein
LLENLKRVPTARFNAEGAPSACLSKTRVQLLEDIRTWFEQDGPAVYWLHGSAGIGKSTVARSVADWAAEEGLLGASFFFSRATLDRRRPNAVVPTLAYQLAHWHAAVRTSVCGVIKKDPDIAICDVKTQFNSLFSTALVNVLSSAPRALIVLDALDECDQIDGHEGGPLLPLLLKYFASRAVPLKLFITSRDEPSIASSFQELDASQPTQNLALHVDIETKLVDEDIRLYLAHELGKISRHTEWYTDHQLTELVRRSQQLFVYAATVVRYLRGSAASRRAAKVLQELLSGSERGRYDLLDDLYLMVLQKSASVPGVDEDEIRGDVRDMAATLVLLQEPMTAEAIACLTDCSENLVSSLQSLLLKSPDRTVRLFHPSFSDFIVNPKRCTDTAFLVESADHHRRLATRCLAVMNEHLRYDICDISKVLQRDEDAAGSKTRLDSKVPTEVRYACKFWLVHVEEAGAPDEPLAVQLHTFFRRHPMHWLEALSYMKELSRVDQHLPQVLAWCQVNISLIATRKCADISPDTPWGV